MGDPNEPGEDQLTTVSIEGPPAGASKAEVDAYKKRFEEFKERVRKLRGEYPEMKMKLVQVKYEKK